MLLKVTFLQISERKKEKLLKLKPYKQIVINLIFWEWNARFSHAKQVFWPQTTTHTD